MLFILEIVHEINLWERIHWMKVNYLKKGSDVHCHRSKKGMCQQLKVFYLLIDISWCWKYFFIFQCGIGMTGLRTWRTERKELELGVHANSLLLQYYCPSRIELSNQNRVVFIKNLVQDFYQIEFMDFQKFLQWPWLNVVLFCFSILISQR